MKRVFESSVYKYTVKETQCDFLLTLSLDVQCQEWPESGHAPYTGRNTGTVSSIDKF